MGFLIKHSFSAICSLILKDANYKFLAMRRKLTDLSWKNARAIIMCLASRHPRSHVQLIAALLPIKSYTFGERKTQLSNHNKLILN